MTETRNIKMSQELFVQLICTLESNRRTCEEKIRQYENFHRADETAAELVDHFKLERERQKQAQKDLNRAWKTGTPIENSPELEIAQFLARLGGNNGTE